MISVIFNHPRISVSCLRQILVSQAAKISYSQVKVLLLFAGFQSSKFHRVLSTYRQTEPHVHGWVRVSVNGKVPVR